jgi:hypothetical protein
VKIVNHHSILTSAIVAFLCACDGILGLDGERQQLGVISFYNDPVVVEAPDTVTRGQPFIVIVRTYGGGCISQGPTEVRVDDLRATVTPFDINSGGHVCTRELRLFRHEAPIEFARSGTATLVFRGVKRPDDEPIVVERTVIVR